jgi:Zn-dependent M32 family carboxypeptidase|tara:strand:- start:238 stop:534 length:297 start_codon:yes stop_codon:yes gene_type:complete
MSIIGIVLGIIAIGLVFWNKKNNNNSLKGNTKNIEQAFIALQKEFTEYQVFNERKREDLEKIIQKYKKNSERSIEKVYKDLEPEIRKTITKIQQQEHY